MAELEDAAEHTATVSPYSLAAKGLPSVCETAALAAAGRSSRLLVPRVATRGGDLRHCRGRWADDRAFHRRRPGCGRSHHACAAAISSRAARCASTPARSCRRRCSPIARKARASSTRRRCRSTRSMAEFVQAHEAGMDVARLHSGDLSIWSALGEQLRRLDAQGIPYTITPGVPAFAAAAAALGQELTLPEVAQSVVLTRTPGRATAMPPTRDALRVRGDAGDARDPSLDPGACIGGRGADPELRRRVSGRRRLSRELAGRAHRARDARDDRRRGREGARSSARR